MVGAIALTACVAMADLALPRSEQTTFCNPVNVNYQYIPDRGRANLLRHRATADPALVTFRGSYYLFSTNQVGYWSSDDLVAWAFHTRSFLRSDQDEDDVVAPAAWAMNDALYVTGSSNGGRHPIFRSTDPKANKWEMVVPVFKGSGIDPSVLVDDDGQVYVYHNSSNTEPMYGQEVDPVTWEIKGQPVPVVRLHPEIHGWERFGESHDGTFLDPFVEGSWMTKHNGKYYLQYGAPGTEFNGYGDGVYVGNSPLGPFTYQDHNPVSLHMGGFARGAGHGSTFQDNHGHWWHTSTIMVSVKNNFERRIGLWRAGFDNDGVMFCDQAYGDYPLSKVDGRRNDWMLLNYQKPVTVSSTLGALSANRAVDEDIKTYWSASTGDPGEWITTDLGAESMVHAIQINYADQSVGHAITEPYHQYLLESSVDRKHWQLLADKSKNKEDVPHDYVELRQPVRARYVRMTNLHMPTGTFALGGLRIFGKGLGAPPQSTQDFISLRANRAELNQQIADRRNVWFKWKQDPTATGHVIRWGVAPGKLYSAVTVYGATEYTLRTLDRDRTYYATIEAFNENGVGPRSDVITVK